MGERTSYPHGTFSWVELTTSDAEGAKSFYEGLFGWDNQDMPVGDDQGSVYTMAFVEGKPVGALFQGGPEQGPPHWNNYVTVDDVDETAGKVAGAGGTLAMEPFDVMDVGRMAIVQDPTGGFLHLWQAGRHIGAGVVNVPGAFTWNDLNTSDPAAAQPFYEQVLGWSFEKVPGDFEYWTIKNGGRMNGGMRPMGPEERQAGIPSHWLPYFAVDDVAASLQRAGELGGQALMGPVEVPGGGTFGVARDPQGAVFAVAAGEFDD
jgi:predicted enzyme related to lactoylglutathione lyase